MQILKHEVQILNKSNQLSGIKPEKLSIFVTDVIIKFVMALKTSLKTIVLEYGMIVIGSFILATGFVFFINPYKIVPGGVYGVITSYSIHYTKLYEESSLVFLG